MTQTALEVPMAIGRAGQLADLYSLQSGDTLSATNEEVSNSLPFGCLVTKSSTDGAKLPTALADVKAAAGIVVLADFFDSLSQIVDVTVNTNAQSAVKPGVTVAVLRRGRIIVIPEATGTLASIPHVRVVSSGGNTQLGSFTPTLEVAKTISLAGIARWITVPTLGTPTVLEIDCAGSEAAVAD
jgi:hypothetical protein